MKIALRSLGSFLAFALFAAPAFAFDTDVDGVEDASDAYPCDRAAAAAVFVPAQGEHSLLLFEDQWPQASDLDFNDVVLGYNYIFQLDENGDAVSLRATFNALAIGGTFHNGLGLRLPVPRTQVARVSRAIGSGMAVELVPSPADEQLTIDISNDLREVFSGSPDGTINSDPNQEAATGRAIEVEVHFTSPVAIALDGAPFDVFIFRSDDRSHEIHRAEYAGTSAMNGALFGSGIDGSSESRWFVDTQGLPFALHVPFLAAYPREQVAISALYPRIINFAASGGASDRDWYLNPGDASFSYQRAGRPTPAFIGADHVPADTGCIQAWGLAVEFGAQRNMFAYGSALDRYGHPVVTGYISRAIPGHTSNGGLDLFVAKYDAFTGQELWIRQFGGIGDETGRDVVLDANDNVYIVGETGSPLGGQPNAGGADAFVMKLSPFGAPIWTRTIGGAGNDTGYGIALDSQNNVVIGGGSSSESIAGAPSQPGNVPSSFLARYSNDGALQFVQHYRTDVGGANNYNYTLDVAVDPLTDAIYAVGSERRYSEHGSAAENQFLARHAADGSLTWVQHIGGHGYRSSSVDHRYAYAFSLSVDGFDGSIFVTGHWYGGANNQEWGDWIRAEGDTSGDATLVKLTSNGVVVWTYTLASQDGADEFGEAVVADGLGGAAYFAGRTGGTLADKESKGRDDYYVAAYDHRGVQRWVAQDGTEDNDVGHVAEAYVEAQDRGTVFVTGNTTGAFDGDDPNRWDVILARHNLVDGGFRSRVVGTRAAWRVTSWGACSQQCGPGTKSRSVVCAFGDGTPADESLCIDDRPPATTTCTIQPSCSYWWTAGNWSQCSTTCGQGQYSRALSCTRSDGVVVADSFCTSVRPPATWPCQNFSQCTYAWRAGDWSQCTAACGGGNHSRTVGCVRSDGMGIADSYCDAATRPAFFESCNSQSCSLDATSCRTLRDGGVTASGPQTIYPNGAGGPAVSVYCDMTTNGGGWTNLNFAQNRVMLANGHYIACRGGLTSTESSITCRDPVFDGNAGQPLFHYFCDGSDRSANYLLDHVAPLLGHRSVPTLGFASLTQRQENTTSTNLDEYCYVAGNVVRWSEPACLPYVPQPGSNGNCTPSFFTLSR